MKKSEYNSLQHTKHIEIVCNKKSGGNDDAKLSCSNQHDDAKHDEHLYVLLLCCKKSNVLMLWMRKRNRVIFYGP